MRAIWRLTGVYLFGIKIKNTMTNITIKFIEWHYFDLTAILVIKVKPNIATSKPISQG
jgi:hypothetical protein